MHHYSSMKDYDFAVLEINGRSRDNFDNMNKRGNMKLTFY